MITLPRILVSTLLAGSAGIAALSVGSVSSATDAAAHAYRLDVAMDGSSFSFEGDLTDSGVPADGTPFVISGYIYPGGTFAQYGDLSGVLPDGSPEFPDKVLGTWHCTGWHLQDGDAVTGPVVATTQVFDLDQDNPGSQLIITNGVELADFYVPFQRAITGGSGMFEGLTGRNTQVLVGSDFNVSGGFNTSFAFALRP